MKFHFSLYMKMLLLFYFLQGCVSLSLGESSFPYTDRTTSPNLNKKGILELNDLTISIRPQNARVNIAIWGPIIPILPLPGAKTRESENFRIYLQLEPIQKSFSLEPSQVIIRTNGKELSPIGYRYFDVYDESTNFAFSLHPSHLSPGHDWQCKDWLNEDSLLTKSNESIHFKVRTCLVLEYPITTLTPQQEFTVVINGLQQGSHQIKVPPVHFRKKNRIRYELPPLT